MTRREIKLERHKAKMKHLQQQMIEEGAHVTIHHEHHDEVWFIPPTASGETEWLKVKDVQHGDAA